jgi:WD40 repeat protein
VRCCLVIDKEAGIIASCSEGELNSIRVWNINDGMCLATLKAHKQTVSALVCLRSVLLVSASHDGKICLWDLNKNLLVNEFDGHGYPVLCLDKSKD